MKTTTPKKTESNRIVVERPNSRMPRIIQRGTTFKSGKTYSRKNRKEDE